MIEKCRWGSAAFLLILMSGILSLWLVGKIFRVGLNLSYSMPLGLYQKLLTTSVHRGDIVAACLPKSVAREGLVRGYLEKGDCPGGAVAVLKTVIAVPGDRVLLTGRGMRVNHRNYYAPFHTYDHRGYTIKRFVHQGLYQQVKTYWLYGVNDTEYSWDSRYYGGVVKRNIRGVYRPVWVVVNAVKNTE